MAGTIPKEKAKIQRPLPDRPFDVVGFGENSVDLIGVIDSWPEPDTKRTLSAFDRMPGGQIATATVAAARLGCRTRYVGVFGDDDEGRWLVATLGAHDVDVTAIVRQGAATRRAVILVEQSTGARAVLENRDAHLTLLPRDLPLDILTSGRVLMLDATDVDASIAAASAAREAGIPVVLDVDRRTDRLERLLATTDVLVTSKSFPADYTGERDLETALRRLADAGPWLIAATPGPEGSVALHEGEFVRTPALQVGAVDTTGAGDAFRAGLVAAWVRAQPSPELATLLRTANVVAGLSCLGRGAQGGLPNWQEVSQWV